VEEKIFAEKPEEKISITAEEVTDIRLTQAGYYWEAGYNEFDFTCRIEGTEDRIHMVQQRHDEGYGLVIRSEKDDIWDRISGSEAFRLEEKLLDEVQYRTYHDRIEKLTSLSNCREMQYELMENDNHNLRNVIGNLWTELREKEDQLAVSVISDSRKKTTEQFHPVDGMSAVEIEEMVSYYVQAKIIENDLDAQVENVIISGSRCREIEKNGSDLDVVVDYKGTIREDDFFNILHEDGFTIAGIVVDINPITEDKTGLLAEYLESTEQYLIEKARERKLEKPSVREKIKQAKQITREKKKANTEKPKNVER
jgi:predicted nucleotidyltransferase